MSQSDPMKLHTSGRTLLIILGVLQITELGNSQETPFQCSVVKSGHYITPSIPDLYFVHENAALFRGDDGDNLTTTERGTTYIFTIPPESLCTGTVVAIQYCYEARNSNVDKTEDINVFNFLSLSASGTLTYTVDSTYTVQSTPTDTMCTDPRGGAVQQVCCDTTTVDDGPTIPSSSYSFGIAVIDDEVRPLAFDGPATAYLVEHFQDDSFGNDGPSEGNTLAPASVTDQFLLLLRIIIEPATTTTEPATTIPLNMITTSENAQTQSPGTTHTNMSSNPTTVDTGATTALPGGSNSGAAVGGAVGGVIVAALVGVVIVVIILLLVRFRSQVMISRQMAIGNAVYGKATIRGHPSHEEYAGVGPHVITTGVPVGLQPQDDCNHYAERGATYEIPIATTNHQEIKGSCLNHTTGFDEDIYMVPAKDEDSLYAQLQNIKTLNFDRKLVRLCDLLGSGQFGTVYKGVLGSGEGGGEVEVAVKTLKEGSGEEDRVKFLQEAAIMGQFRHHNVVTMYGVVTAGEPILLVLELLVKGDLRDHLLHMRSDEEGGVVSVDDHTLLSYCRQVASGMAYLSNKAFVHRDLAARNILVSEDEICKIADFGMSRDLMEGSYYTSHGGKIPVKWTAPEALHYKKYSTASDVWSYGVLMYEIWSVGHKPFESYGNSKVIRMLDTGYRLPPPPGCPRDLYTIMMLCWHPVTTERLSFPDITRQLSLPDTKLLKWSEEDKAVHPEAAKLGADLLCGEALYKDLQTLYYRGSTN